MKQTKQSIFLIILGVVLGNGKAILATSAQAQIIPDDSLREERSTLQQGINDRGQLANRVEGGARRGNNLFHSFSEFNVGEGERLYFANPTGVETILTRVTGSNPSNVLGTLGVDGPANLFLLNPHGILFGANATLDVRGSFVATTANAIGLGEDGQFSATTPETSNLLSVNPSAFFFNALDPQGAIVNRSTTGLAVPEGRGLVLLGGPVRLADSGGVFAPGGRIELGGLSNPGVVGLVNTGTTMNLQFAAGTPLADVTVDNAIADVRGNGGAGSIFITAQSLSLADGAQLDTSTTDRGNAGNIIINARERISFEGFSAAFSIVEREGIGNGGTIRLSTNSLALSSGSQLITSSLGQGNAGNIIIEARDRVSLNGLNSDLENFNEPDSILGSGILSSVEVGGIGNGGTIRLSTGSLSLTNGGQIVTSSRGQGNAGNIVINARERVSLDGLSPNRRDLPSAIFSTVESGGVGNGGTIRLSSGSLSLTNDGQLATSSRGQGNAGNIVINAREQVSVEGVSTNNGISSAVLSSVEVGGIGNGGTIRLSTDSLSLTNGGQLITSSRGQGNAGNIVINAREQVALDGFSQDRGTSLFSSVLSAVEPEAIGNGGTIRLSADSLLLTNRGVIATASLGQGGDAGDIVIDVRGRLQAENSRITAEAEANRATGGNIEIQAQDVRFSGDSDIISSVERGRGRGGDIMLRADSITSLDDSDILAFSVDGTGGNISLDTSIFLRENAASPENTLSSRVELNALSESDNGQVDINASGRVQSGTIALPDAISLQNDLIELPTNFIDTETLVATSCVQRDRSQNNR
jgi:filamentous hemagglutinin family protein